MDVILQDRLSHFEPKNLEELKNREKWVYETVGQLDKRENCDKHVYINFLGKVLDFVRGKPEGERLWAARLLGAFGRCEKTDILIRAATKDPNSWVRRTASNSLVEIGEPSGEHLIAKIDEFSDEEKIIALRMLRSIMHNPCVSLAFKWLCYCTTRELLYDNLLSGDNKLLCIQAATLIGYFTDTDDLARIKDVKTEPYLKQRLLLAARSDPRPSGEMFLEKEEQKQLFHQLAEYFCLTDTNIITELCKSKANLSRLGIYSLFQAFGSAYRPSNGVVDKNILDNLLKNIYSNENTEAADNGNLRECQDKYLGLISRVLQPDMKIHRWPELLSISEWREWAMKKWNEAKIVAYIKFEPVQNDIPRITFRQSN